MLLKNEAFSFARLALALLSPMKVFVFPPNTLRLFPMRIGIDLVTSPPRCWNQSDDAVPREREDADAPSAVAVDADAPIACAKIK